MLRSRKFWIAVVSAVAMVLTDGVGLAPGIGQAIVTIGGVLIGAIALEDAASKRAGGA